MSGRSLGVSVSQMLGLLIAAALAAPAPVWAQTTDNWSFVITPQVWISHIAKNGFSSPNSLGLGIVDRSTGTFLQNPFTTTKSTSTDALDPQWGLQAAAQKGRLTLAGAFQYVTFETRNDIAYTPSNGAPINRPDLNNPFCVFLGSFDPRCQPITLNPGDRAAQEFVDTTRMDFDLSASYFFPDVTRWLDLSVGGGFKFIYATASRQYANLNPVMASVAAPNPPGLYQVCTGDSLVDPSNPLFLNPDCTFKDRVKTKSYLYAATIPMSAIFRLTSDSKWLLPFSVTPLLGAETRNDEDVVYSVNPNGTINRLDGTTFAYGVTADATLRYIINDTFSAYAGMRVQYINGHEEYLAYGPLVGLSVRFGGK